MSNVTTVPYTKFGYEMKNYLGKNHHVYFDSFFSSVTLMKLLLMNNTYACATTRSSRKEWPTELKYPKKLRLQRGESRNLQSGKVTATVWHDNREICILQTNCDPNKKVYVQRKTGKGNKQTMGSCPHSVALYTKYMGGVDRADQRRCYYDLGRKTKKWWKYLFAFVLNTAIVNSFILYKETNSPSNTRHGVTQKNFRLALYRQMIGNFSSRKVIGRKRILPMNTFSQRQQHSLVKIVGRKKVCAYYSSKKRKTPAGRSIETS